MPQDLSKLSNEELLAIANQKPETSKPDLSKMSDDDLIRLAGLDKSKEPKLTKLESGISGTAQGLTLGFSDEAIGGVRAFIGSMQGEGKYGDLYKKYRDEQRTHIAKAERDNPKSYVAGMAAGSLGLAFMPGSGLLIPGKGATIAGSIGKAALGGGTLGAGLSNATPTESPESAKKFAGDIAKGAALGAAFQGGASLFGKGVSALKPSNLSRIAEEKAVKAAGAMTKELRELGEKGYLHDLGRELLDKKVVRAFSTLKGIGERAGKLKEEAGKKIGEAISAVDDLVTQTKGLIDEGKLFSWLPDGKGILTKINGVTLPTKKAAKTLINQKYQFNMARIGQRIEDELVSPNMINGQPIPNLKNEVNKLISLANDYKNFDPVSLGKGLEIKGTQRKLTKFASESIPESFKQDVYQIIKSELDEIVGRTGNLQSEMMSGLNLKINDLVKAKLPNINEQTMNEIASTSYKNANKTYAQMAYTEDIAAKRLGATQSNRAVSLTDTIVAAGGIASGSPATGVVLGALNKLGRQFGSSVQAKSADALAKILEKSPDVLKKFIPGLENAAKKSPSALIAEHLSLMGNPEYRTIIKLSEDEEKRGLKIPEQTKQPKGLNIPGQGH